MGKKTMEIRFCDSCGKEIIGRLTFRICPCCGKDICMACQAKENAKHIPRERKLKTVPAVKLPEKEVTTEQASKPDDGKEKMDNVTAHLPDISTFKVRQPDKGQNHDYILSLGGLAVGSKSLRRGTEGLLRTLGIDQSYIAKQPDSEGKRQLLAILNE